MTLHGIGLQNNERGGNQSNHNLSLFILPYFSSNSHAQDSTTHHLYGFSPFLKKRLMNRWILDIIKGDINA